VREISDEVVRTIYVTLEMLSVLGDLSPGPQLYRWIDAPTRDQSWGP